ncbi:MAG TPA: isoprenylcysteine carboxylmethyltransferase family protein [Gemmatimonadaceae bacterium]|nr:isoprenylcysteine carboxylmethyltransferase family protein [Gemmatimonadaceae bacterium]
MSTISRAEQTTAARVGAWLFRYRGFLPVPFILVPLLVPGEQTTRGWLIAALFILAGEVFRMMGVSAAGTVTRRRSRDVQRLVTYGIFSWMRNPLYVGNLLIWVGFVIGSGVLWFLPVAIVLFAIEYTLIVRYEEGVLESIFGAEYLAYKQRTPRWFPRPPRERSSGQHDYGEALRSEVSTFAQYAALGVAFYVKHRLTRG